MYSIKFTENNKKFCFSMHYNGANSYLFVNLIVYLLFIHKSKAKGSGIVATSLCLGNVSKNWSVENMKKTELNRYVHDFGVDYDAIAVADILDIHKYLMKTNEIVENIEICERCSFSNDVL